MKPDGVATVALEPMETLESNPGSEGAPAVGQEQAASPAEEEIPQQPEAASQAELQAPQAKETPAAKMSNKTSGDSKAKMANKATPKAKPGTTGTTKTTSGPRSNTTQSRLSNGVSKPQSNGVAKKSTPAPEKKSAPAPAKKVAAPNSKVGEKKVTAAAPASSGAKPMTATAVAKKTPPTTANGVKTNSGPAKKPPAPKPATPTRPGSAATAKAEKPPASKPARSATGTTASPRPPTGSARTPPAARSSTPKTPSTSTAPKPATSKTTSSAPSSGKAPASQASRNATPVKKDVTKPATPAAKKPAESPLTRPSSTTKSAKPETPKSAKKPPAGKAADTKTPTRSKTQDSKPAPSKTPGSKAAAAKNSSPKKTVGSSTPTPVKRGPKPATEMAAAVAAAAAIATAATVIAGPEEPKPQDISETVSVPEPAREPTPEPIREPTPDPVREPTPDPVREPTPDPVREPTPEPLRDPTPEHVREPSPYHLTGTSPELPVEISAEPAFGVCSIPSSAQLDLFKFEESANDSVPCLGTTVMSPPCSPPCPVSPVREPQAASSLLDTEIQSDLWDQNRLLASSDIAFQSMGHFQREEEMEVKEHFEAQETREEEEEENLFLSTSSAPSAAALNLMAQPHLLGASPLDEFVSGDFISPRGKEDAVEKADEEINEDDDDDEDDEDADEEHRRLGHQPSSMITDMSMSQPSEEFQVRSSGFGGSAAWPGDDLLSGMDSEDVSSCTSSRQQGVSDLSSTLHTAILEGTQSSDALVDSSLRGSEGDGNLMGSPNVETLANEEEDEEEDEDERVDDMDLSSERLEEHHTAFQQEKHEEEDDEDVEMHSEGVTENVDEDDFNQDERLDNLNRPGPAAGVPPGSSSWGHTDPFCDAWAQPASPPSPVSDHGAAESETPTQSPAQACLDSSAPPFEPRGSAPEDVHALLAPAAAGLSRSGAVAPRSSSETSTPEELRDYDSSSGVESRSDKQQTPVPASVQPDMDQDLGIHLEKGDGEEEEAETLPADEILGTGPPTAPASAPSSPSTSGDEASDTEGEMQINEPDAPTTVMDKSAGFESPPPTCNLPALEEDEEAADVPAGEGEEDGGGVTPQSANSVASYGFDCTTSNSNAHSMAESCGKSPGIFSLENEEQLPEEAKDPSLIKELTLPSAATAAQAEERLGAPVDLMPLGHPADICPGLDEHRYMLGGKAAADEEDPLESSRHPGARGSADAADSQPPYYSTICDKTDSFLAGDVKRNAADEERELQTHSQEDNRNQNHTLPVANGHYLAMVPGNRRPIDPTLAAHFAKMAPPPLVPEAHGAGGEQLRRLEQHQEKLKEMQHRQEQERQKRQWLEEERLRLEQQKQLEKQRRELLQLQLQQQQQEHRHRRQLLQWQLELEQQYRMQQKQVQQQQQQLRRSPTGVTLSPSSGLCTIYEAMETSDEEDDGRAGQNRNEQALGRRAWNTKVDMVQQLINQTLMLSGDGGCPPLLLLPVGSGGTLSPLESSAWPELLPQFRPPDATVTSVSSYSPDHQGSSPPGDWTVVEVETQH